MLTLLFFRTGDKPLHAAGPVPFLRVAGGSLRMGPEGEQLGYHRGGFWRVAGHDVPKFVVSGSGPLLLEAEQPDESIVLGEFPELEFIDGAIYSRPENNLLARLDESAGAWYLYADGSLHTTLMLEESSVSEHSVKHSSAVVHLNQP